MLKKIALIASGLVFLGIGLAAQIDLNPLYADARFTPANVYHAGCLNELGVSLKATAKENISSLRIIVEYDPLAVQILSVKAADGLKDILDTQIESDKIVASIVSIPNTGDITKLFTIAFKSTDGATGTKFMIRKPSYLMNKKAEKISIFSEQNVSFAKVEECEPDILPPTIRLLKPATESGVLAIDNYFAFDIKDTGKGVAKDSLKLHFAGKTYTGADKALVWKDDTLYFYPENWLPLGSKLDLSLRISDKQVYGGANETKKVFSFQTSTGILFDQNLTPAMLRTLLDKASTIFASTEECQQLADNIITSKDLGQIKLFAPLAEKIGCSLDTQTLQTKILEAQNKKETSSSQISVFALIGWLLFVISFFLKIHYLASARKHKKLAAKAAQSLQ